VFQYYPVTLSAIDHNGFFQDNMVTHTATILNPRKLHTADHREFSHVSALYCKAFKIPH
jgi:hypothetical protein